MLFNAEKCVVLHLCVNNNLYTNNMSNVSLKTVDVEMDLLVIINKKEKYS